jgi:hypothetical protein
MQPAALQRGRAKGTSPWWVLYELMQLTHSLKGARFQPLSLHANRLRCKTK